VRVQIILEYTEPELKLKKIVKGKTFQEEGTSRLKM
jgi:hypothetical protein